MNLLLKIVNNPQEVINSISYEFKQQGGTIGRNTDCSWVLIDKLKIISGIHLEIDYKKGQYYLIDLSSNGTVYKNENRKVPSRELILLNEGDLLSLGNYDILVGFVKSNIDSTTIDNFLNQREMDIALEDKVLLNEEGNSPLDIIVKEKVEEKDILEFANIIPNEELFRDDAFEEFESENLYNSHIAPPSFEDEKVEELLILNENDNVLLSVFSAKLGISLSNMSRERQIEIVSDLSDTILTAIEGTEKLLFNIEQIEKKLEKPKLKVNVQEPKSVKSMLHTMLYSATPKSVSTYLFTQIEKVKMHHTALYEASKEQSEMIEQEFSPNTLSKEFRLQKSLFFNDSKNWRAYKSKYQYLNEVDGLSSEKSLKKQLFKKYKKILETLLLVKS